ncbi:putative Phototropic-responsive NPH3 family protein [Hibiscus syriacus]|uniref:Phototropic-responsive NPH3 family protein n=1 Tax=Hibiscus syriacus TaxID=106335 RepID=A0A6A3BH07_HIBSY|nr:putative Phototropic-responsive NPH3 family protein [Hibiscus syriacus]
MVLRGQGDSPVRICEPCKTLEEPHDLSCAMDTKVELGEVLFESSSSGVISSKDMSPSVTRAASSASSSNVVGGEDGGGEIRRSQSVDQRMQNDMASLSPEELRQQALDEKRKKNRKKSLPSGNMSEIQNIDATKDSGRKNRASSQVGKDDLAAELRELGWSDMDLHNENKGSTSMSLEGELSSLLGEMPKKNGKHGPDKTQVVAFKKKALMLKREGKLAEAKEELKRAKILEKQLEEQELLAGADDSDDELSAIINSMDNDKEDEMLIQYEHIEGFDFDHLLGAADDIGIDSNFEVTDNDMEDPEIVTALKSLGWAEDSNPSEDVVAQSAPVNREALLNEILSLKREALNQKRAGNVAEAMAQLKKAKLLEKDLENFESQPENLTFDQNVPTPHAADISVKSAKLDVNAMKDMGVKPARKIRGRRKKGKILEQQLEDMENASNMKTAQVTIGNSMKDSKGEHPSLSVTLPVEGEDVTDHDMHDPTYLSILRNLGWNENDELSNSLPKHSTQNDSEKVVESSLIQSTPKIPTKASRRTKAEIQRELLGLKRKALSLRRQGNTDEAEEVLEAAKALEAELAEMEAPKEVVESKWPNEKATVAPLKGVVEEVDEDAIGNDMTDPAMLSILKNLGWKDDEMEPVTMQEKHSKHLAIESLHSGRPSATESSLGISALPPRSKRVIERELLDLKRRALALRRKGQAEEAEDLLQKAKVLEAEMAAPKEELVFDVSRDSKPQNFESFANNEGQGILKDEVKGDFGSNSSLAKTDAPSSSQNLGTKDEDTIGKSRLVNGEQKAHVFDASLSQEAFTSQNNQDSLRQAVLSHKKQALALKRDGKLAEARDELQQAKLLEKSLTEGGTPPKAGSPPKSGTNDGSICASTGPSDVTKEKGASSVAPKPLSGRDRFKLQQESLSHKRQALKLRREGRIQEAEAEFEIAKSLEAQLEESAGNDLTNTGAGKADDVVVEDLLDPQLLSALNAIGLDDSSAMEHNLKRQHPVKPNAAKTDDVKQQERIQLEERIKAEKVKAVNLKRSGKQAEALEALRRAKMLEKKLNSLPDEH